MEFPPAAGLRVPPRAKPRRPLSKLTRATKKKLIPELDKLIALRRKTKEVECSIRWPGIFTSPCLIGASREVRYGKAWRFDEQKTRGGKGTRRSRNFCHRRRPSCEGDFEVSLGQRLRTHWARSTVKLGETGKASAVKQSFQAGTADATAITLGDLALKKGDDAAAFDYLLTAAAARGSASRLPAPAQAQLELLYAKLHKDQPRAKSLDALLDERDRKLPTVDAAPYQPTPAQRPHRPGGSLYRFRLPALRRR